MIVQEVYNDEDYGFGYTTHGEPIDESMVDELYRIANEILERSDLAREDPYVTIDESSFNYWCDGSSYVLEEFNIIFNFSKSGKWLAQNGMFDFENSESQMWRDDDYEFECLIGVKDGKVVAVDWTDIPDTRYDVDIDYYVALRDWVESIANPVAMDIYNSTTNI